ncbi:urokinase plasminogen activator surface receptor-like [Scyliorhinus torazame]|uniref:urokinase plasminogen activator surface receptor-like n=1 Tax=Scyliorhinus torazame TaxID=75743 RepID=UPI003B5CDA9D
MKLFSGIFIICALVTEARSFNCNQCSGISGTCTFTPTTCASGTTSCSTSSTTQIYGGMTKKQISNSCGPCSDPVSFNCGSVVVSQSSSCCDTDRCNTRIDTAPRNNTVNGLQCRGCFNSSSDYCSASEQTVDCVGAENRCMNVSGIEALISGENRFFAKGCVSEQICQAVDSMIEFRILFNDLPTCCMGDFCNGDPERRTSTPEPGITMSSPVTSESSSRRTTSSKASPLKCFSCERPTEKCTQQEVCDPALNLNCRTILATLTVAGTSQESVIYGCGNCTGNLSFNGGRLSAAVTERCCQSDLCNNQTITEEANATLNGLECNTCATLSGGMCQDAKEMVKCVGKQTRCLHSSVMYLSRNYTIKGCVSESFCKNANTITIPNIQLNQDIDCCNRSGCNGSPGSTAQTAIFTNNVTVYNDSPAVRSLIALPLITLIPCMF